MTFRPRFVMRVEALERRRMLSAAAPSAGDLDPAFGRGGTVVARTLPAAVALVVQADGKIVTLGTQRGPNDGDFQLARFNPDGSPDRTFGYQGRLVTDFAGRADTARGLALQPDGKIIAVGEGTPKTPAPGEGGRGEIARYNPDGSLDPTFGDGGRLSTDPTYERAGFAAVAVTPGGKILVGGQYAKRIESDTGPTYVGGSFIVWRYNPDGSPDPAFGAGGISAPTSSLYNPFGQLKTLAVAPDGRVFTAGSAFSGFAANAPVIVAYSADGVRDATAFKSDKPPGSYAGYYALAFQPDGKILAGGFSGTSGYINMYAPGPPASLLLARNNPDGAYDPTFADAGVLLRSGNGSPFIPAPFSQVLVQPDGGILAAGTTFVPGVGGSGANPEPRWGVFRFTPAGAPDLTFGDAGAAGPAFDRASGVAAAALAPDGTLVVAGDVDNSLALARYFTRAAGPAAGAGTGGDVDREPPARPGGAPNAPFGLTAPQPDPYTARVQFYDNADNETGFVIERERSVDEATFQVVATLGPSPGRGKLLTWVDHPIHPRGGYIYRVRAVAGGVSSVWTYDYTSVYSAGADDAVPEKPFAFTGRAASATAVVLRFYDNSFGESGFTFERTELGPDGKPIAGQPTAGTAANPTTLTLTSDDGLGWRTYIDTTARPGKRYTYRLSVYRETYDYSGPGGGAYRTFRAKLGRSVTVTTPAEPPARHPFRLDPTFGRKGLVVSLSAGAADDAVTLADGKILVLERPTDPVYTTGDQVYRYNGAGRPAANGRGLRLVRFNPDGSPDLSFGSAGLIVTDVPFLAASTPRLALQRDGKILVVGTTDPDLAPDGNDGPGDVLVERLDPDGSPDPTFGSAGRAVVAFSPAGAPALHVQSYATSVAVAADGKILVGGGFRSGAAVARLNPDGSPDPTFGKGGRAMPPSAYAAALAVGGDGRAVFASGQSYNFAVLSRLNADGSADASAFAERPFVFPYPNLSGPLTFYHDVAVLGDGKVLIAGQDRFGNALLVRYNADGTLDTTFGYAGGVTTLLPAGAGAAFFTRLHVQADSRILAGGGLGDGVAYQSKEGAPFLARFNADGTPDYTFAPDGVTTDPGVPFGRFTALLDGPRGAVLAVGRADVGTANPYNVRYGDGGGASELLLARYAPAASRVPAR